MIFAQVKVRGAFFDPIFEGDDTTANPTIYGTKEIIINIPCEWDTSTELQDDATDKIIMAINNALIDADKEHKTNGQ